MSDLSARLSGALADRYTIERELGAGGMATVYLAHDVRHDRSVAIKVLRPELAAVLGAERFVQEIRTTASLQHPHILPLYESGEADSFLYYVMPYIEGETLRDRLNREKQLPVHEAVRIATEIADALDYAHRQNVIHRDIKPENILLHDGRPLVADFGIALAVSAAAGGRMTETGLSLGTPHYMSPEQATAEKDLGHRSDIYSLGAVLYEMLTGDPPHTGSTAQQIIAKIVTEDPAPVTNLRRSVPPNVAASVAKCLEKLPADRFEDARAFARALKDPGYAPARVTTRGEGVGRGGVWRRLAVFGAAAALIAMAASGWLRPAPPSQVMHLGVRLDPTQAWTEPVGLQRTLAVAPGGSMLAYRGSDVTRQAGDSATGIFLRSLDRLNGAMVPESRGNSVSPRFSHDGRRLAFWTFPTGITVVPVTGGAAARLPAGGAEFDWGDDGYLYMVDSENRLIRTNPGSEIADTLWQSARPGVEVRDPAVLPGGRGILLNVVDFEQRTMEIVALDPDFTERPVVPGGTPTYVPSGYLAFVTTDGTLMVAPFDPRRLTMTAPAVATVDDVRIYGGAAQYALGDDGTLVYIRGAVRGRQRLVWMSRTGVPEPIDWIEPQLYSSVALSPEADGLAAGIGGNFGRGDIFVFDLLRRTRTRITYDGMNHRPQWTPDGQRVSYLSRIGPGIFQAPADGSAQPSLITAIPDHNGELRYPGSGGILVYRVWDAGPDGELSRNVYRVHPDSIGSPKAVLQSRFDERTPTFSPDGRWIAYTSNESGRDEIYVQRFPEGSGRTTLSPAGGALPIWSADGSEIFYRDAGNTMVAVAVSAGERFAVRSRTPLFSLDGYHIDEHALRHDASADGQRFLLVTDEPSEPDELVIVRGLFNMVEGALRNR